MVLSLEITTIAIIIIIIIIIIFENYLSWLWDSTPVTANENDKL